MDDSTTPVKSAYAHIPFCARKCLYCDFNSFTSPASLYSRYTDAICREIEQVSRSFQNERLSTIFVGGGTPNLLPSRCLDSILSRLRDALGVEPDAEISVEANPGACERGGASFADLRAIGFNRLSMGVQSFDNEELRKLGRIHDADEAVRSFGEARHAGFENVSVDLMYGIPSQTMASWKRTLSTALSLGPEHLSLYALSVEDGTPFAEMDTQGRLIRPDEETEASMYEVAIETLSAAGYEHYEISNFARPGFECRHNQTYWRNEPYFGFGAGAASYLRGRRASNIGDVLDYITAVEECRATIAAEESLDGRASMGETVFLGLRMIRGVSRDRFRRRYGVDVAEIFGAEIAAMETRGLLEMTSDSLRLTRSGLLLANIVFAEFVE